MAAPAEDRRPELQGQHMKALADYYAKRAPDYDRIYEKPERQADLAMLRELVGQAFADRAVLEVACGTGYWTQVLARTSHRLVATDINDEVLAIARTRPFGSNVRLCRCDAFRLEAVPGEFNAALAVFWWSHLTRSQLHGFLAGLRRKLDPGSLVVFIDNIYAHGSSTPISRRDEQGNTYQMRQLNDGSTVEVLKNFPTDEEIRSALADGVAELSIERLTYYWMARCTVGRARMTPEKALNDLPARRQRALF
jgi:ubiquinone/menaquinone biosynthesis C-methylase UbiE